MSGRPHPAGSVRAHPPHLAPERHPERAVTLHPSRHPHPSRHRARHPARGLNRFAAVEPSPVTRAVTLPPSRRTTAVPPPHLRWCGDISAGVGLRPSRSGRSLGWRNHRRTRPAPPQGAAPSASTGFVGASSATAIQRAHRRRRSDVHLDVSAEHVALVDPAPRMQVVAPAHLCGCADIRGDVAAPRHAGRTTEASAAEALRRVCGRAYGWSSRGTPDAARHAAGAR